MATDESMDAAMALMQGLLTDGQGIKRVLEFLAAEAMEREVTAHLGAGRHERTADRQGHRNGSKPRTLKTRVGELELSVPQVRGGCGPYHPSLFGRFQRSERALLVACGEMYFQGVSTRRVQEVLGEMCGAGVELSAMTVSRVAAELDEKLSEFRRRRLDQTSWPYVQVDARYERVRAAGGRVVSRAVLVTVGFDAEGRREVLDWRLADSESAQSWGELFKGLKDRGLSGVRLVTSDAHGGIRAAVERHFQGASWQRCRVHFKRELSAKVPYKRSKELMDDVRSVLAGHDRAECLRRGEEMASKWEGQGYPAAGRMVREGLEDCLAVLGFPEQHRVRLGSTNLSESLMRRIKRRTRVVGVFPNEASCDRLVGALLLETHEGWLSEEVRQFNMGLTS